MSGRVLVGGIGNIFLGDDAFGVEVARFDLAYALLDGYEAAVLIDVTRPGGEPGTLYVLELPTDAPEPATLTTHEMDPQRVLELVKTLGDGPRTLRLVGCEPQRFAARPGPARRVSDARGEALRPGGAGDGFGAPGRPGRPGRCGHGLKEIVDKAPGRLL